MKTLLLVLLCTTLAWAQPRMETDKPCYLYDAPIQFVGSGLPPETPIMLYSAFYEDGEPQPGPDQMSFRDSITTGPRGIIEGQLRAPSSGNQGHRGTFLIEARPNNDRSGAVLARIRVVPVAVTPEFVGYEDTNGSLNLEAVGFLGFPSLYVHYILQTPGKPNRELKTVKVGDLQAPEGSLKVKFKKFPFKPVPKGGYLIQFDPFEKYEPLERSSGKPFILFSTSVVE